MGSPKNRYRSPTLGTMNRDSLVLSSVYSLCLKCLGRMIEVMESLDSF